MSKENPAPFELAADDKKTELIAKIQDMLAKINQGGLPFSWGLTVWNDNGFSTVSSVPLEDFYLTMVEAIALISDSDDSGQVVELPASPTTKH